MHEAFFANSTDVHLQRKRIKMKRFSQQITNNTESAEDSFAQMFSDHGIPSGMSTGIPSRMGCAGEMFFILFFVCVLWFVV